MCARNRPGHVRRRDRGIRQSVSQSDGFVTARQYSMLIIILNCTRLSVNLFVCVKVT